MSSILSFDEMNRLGMPQRSMPYEQYFGEMDLTKGQIEDRTEFAQRMEDIVRTALILMLLQYEFGIDDAEFAAEQMKRQYGNLVTGLAAGSILVNDYIPQMVDRYVESTMARPTDPYTFSEDRIRLTAENDANTVYNEDEYVDGIGRGFTRKMWVTMHDSHVRETHAEVDGEILPIDEYYEVGGSLMRFPKDFSMSPSPEETVNCRCSIKYLR